MVFRRTPRLLKSLRDGAAPSTDSLSAAREILWIALVVRKLSDAGELSPELQRRCWPVAFHPRRDVMAASRDELARSYALEYSRDDSLSTLRLCGMLIHCAVLDSTEDGFYFTSHVEQQDGLFFLRWPELGQIVDAICDDGARSGVIRAA